MTLVVETPNTHVAERDYILSVILGEFLGLTWLRVRADDGAVRLGCSGLDGHICLPDCFFAQPDDAWCTAATLPQFVLGTWDSRLIATDISLTDPVVPVIYGVTDPTLRQSGQTIELPIDLLGSAFFMLSRYEEAVLTDRDDHDRFPATASVAYQAGFLDRPIIDEYVEVLWAAIHRLWPLLKRKRRQPRTLVSCDVDSPFAYSGSLRGMARCFVGDLVKRRDLGLARRNLRGYWRAGHHDFTLDLHRSAIDWIMDVNERAGRQVAFYFIPENSAPGLDGRVSLDEQRMRVLLRQIHARGHEIGIHPGYNTYKHPAAFARSVATLRRVLDEEGIAQPLLGGRQHFLRWETPTTARLWDDNGLDYDTTLSYADRPGFRCGTCHEYPLYDVRERRPLTLRERPLIVMECSVIDERYLGLGHTEAAFERMQYYRRICHGLGGDFTLLWHNSHFAQPRDRDVYQALVGN